MSSRVQPSPFPVKPAIDSRTPPSRRPDPIFIGHYSGPMGSTTDAPPETERSPGATGAVFTDPPWLVIVWNDPINLMSYVAYVFQKLFGYDREKAVRLMLQVHHGGKAVVSSGPRERAELDVFRLHEHGLWATMQQDAT